MGGSLQLLPLHRTRSLFSLSGPASRDWFRYAPPRGPLGCCRVRLQPGWLCLCGSPLKRPDSHFPGDPQWASHLAAQLHPPPVPGCDQLVNSPVSVATAEGCGATCFRWGRNLPGLDRPALAKLDKPRHGESAQDLESLVHRFQRQDLGVAPPMEATGPRAWASATSPLPDLA